MQTTIKQFIQPDNYCMPENVKEDIYHLLIPYHYRCLCRELLTNGLQVHSLYQSVGCPDSYFAISSVKCPNCGEEQVFVTNLYKSGNTFYQLDTTLTLNLHEFQLLATYVRKFYPPILSDNPLPPHIACRRLFNTLLKYHLYQTIDRYTRADVHFIKQSINTHSSLEYNCTYMRKTETEILNIVKIARKLHAAYNSNFSSNLIMDFLFLSPANFSQKYMK